MEYQCKQCLAMTSLPANSDPHAHTWCSCCTITGDSGAPHHHGRGVLADADCEAANHPGMPCFNPPGHSDKPAGCTVCRPVIHFAVAGDPAVI